MKTRDKDFTGCNPEIAKALKNGKDIKCLLWDDHEREGGAKAAWVTVYSSDRAYPYVTAKRLYQKAKPIKTKKIVKPFYELVEQLKKEGYKFDAGAEDNGLFKLEHASKVPFFDEAMFRLCGKSHESNRFIWREEWLTEVEE